MAGETALSSVLSHYLEFLSQAEGTTGCDGWLIWTSFSPASSRLFSLDVRCKHSQSVFETVAPCSPFIFMTCFSCQQRQQNSSPDQRHRWFPLWEVFLGEQFGFSSAPPNAQVASACLPLWASEIEVISLADRRDLLPITCTAVTWAVVLPTSLCPCCWVPAGSLGCI